MRTTTAAPATVTATSKRLAGAIVALGLAAAGCGGQARVTTSAAGDRAHEASTQAAALEQAATSSGGGFAWLRPALAPAGWRAAVIPSGAMMSYPPQWKRISGDAGTATAVLLNGKRRIVGYLNVTPRQGRETLSNWGHFRVDHNADEGDRSIRRLDVGTGLRFRHARGSCVRDSYTTGSGNPYVELACIVAGHTRTTVIVGASPPQMWRRISPALERAIASFTA